MLRGCLLLVLGLVFAMKPIAGSAQTIDGNNPVQVTTLTVGTLLGLTNSVATVVYAVQNRSFETPWVVSSFVSTAACGAFAVGIAVNVDEGGNSNQLLAAIPFLLLAIVPASWSIRGALSEVGPGERFDTLPPLEGPAATLFTLPALRF